jgi:hypothetical protein
VITVATGCGKSSAPTPVAAERTLTLSGAAAETAPNAHLLAGVRLQITDGPDAGLVATSDSTGSFRFAVLRPGAIGIVATKDGYLPWRVLNLSVETYPQIQVVLYPVPPGNASGTAATARCNDGTWSWEPSLSNLCAANGGVAYTVCPGPLCIGGRQ